MAATTTARDEGRWALYRLLAEPGRLRLLALVAEEELSVGELAELLDDSQPNVSRQTTTLRQGGLVVDRRQGTRTFVRFAQVGVGDPVVNDAVQEGRRLCRNEGRLDRIAAILGKRDERARAPVEAGASDANDPPLANELPVYALAVARLTVERGTAVDAGTGDGALLDMLAPSFRRVIAIERSSSQLLRAEARVRQRGYDNVELLCGESAERECALRVGAGANAVFASRLLHHAASPRVTMSALAALLRPGGELLVIDYQTDHCQALREHGPPIGKGFAKDELIAMAHAAGLEGVAWFAVPNGFIGGGVGGHLPWQMLRAMRPVVAT